MSHPMLLGIPDITAAFTGVDSLGQGCRIDPTVSIMRYGSRPMKSVCMPTPAWYLGMWI